jgi:hypothetical protein
MTITIESTSKVVSLNGVACRVWEGQTVSGVKVHCYIPRICAKDDQDLTQFERELQEQRVPSVECAGIPLWMIL